MCFISTHKSTSELPNFRSYGITVQISFMEFTISKAPRQNTMIVVHMVTSRTHYHLMCTWRTPLFSGNGKIENLLERLV